MQGVFAAEPAVFVHFQSVRIVLFVFDSVVIALLALGAGQDDFDSHNGTSDSSRAAGIFEASLRGGLSAERRTG